MREHGNLMTRLAVNHPKVSEVNTPFPGEQLEKNPESKTQRNSEKRGQITVKLKW